MSPVTIQAKTTLLSASLMTSLRGKISASDQILIDCAFRTYIYSSLSWVHHCSASYRKLALNRQVLGFAQSGLQTWADLGDKWYETSTISCLRDVLSLSKQNTG